MSVTVERCPIARLVHRRLGDGVRTIIEGLEYVASCGCTAVAGVRVDNTDKTLGYQPCEQHKPRANEVLAALTGPDSPTIDTEIWMAELLTRMHP